LPLPTSSGWNYHERHRTLRGHLRRHRKAAGLSQEETAVRASLHRTAVGQLERGERVARVDTLIKLAGSLEIEPGELLTGLSWQPGGTRFGRFELPDDSATL
jgi:transcriptional regulator with XRE-family HTH domain